MRDSTTPRAAVTRSPSKTLSERLARSARREAIERGDAVLVGTLDGVVEWADDAWVRLTGFPLEETVDKPIGHFLDRAGLERELVEFVAHHFLEGRPCTVALPFDTFDGRHVDVTLEVERWRDPERDATRFIAVAREVERRDEAPATSASIDRPMPPLRPAGAAALLEPIVLTAADAGRPARHAVRAFDVHLAPASGLRVAPAEPIAPILEALLEAARAALDSGPTFVSVVAGPLEAGRSHHSLVHAIPNRAVASRRIPGCYAEVHDTGPHLTTAALARLRSGEPGVTPRERALARALAQAHEAGLALHLDSTPGCGTQALLVLDRAAR
ncbi:MAG: PAS domain-containing protein [Myxococcota bacterium]